MQCFCLSRKLINFYYLIKYFNKYQILSIPGTVFILDTISLILIVIIHIYSHSISLDTTYSIPDTVFKLDIAH